MTCANNPVSIIGSSPGEGLDLPEEARTEESLVRVEWVRKPGPSGVCPYAVGLLI